MDVTTGSTGAARRWIMVVLKYAAVGALGIQAVHLVEHIAQLTYWFAHPAHAPWLTPWAMEGRDILASGGRSEVGNELLHLIGNLIFLGGLMALLAYHRRRTGEAAFPALRIGLVVQGIHVVEHVALTVTSVVVGKAIGLSTFFGLVAGPVMTSYRVWFHFLVNLAATWYAFRALIAMHRLGLLVGSAEKRPLASAADLSRGV